MHLKYENLRQPGASWVTGMSIFEALLLNTEITLTLQHSSPLLDSTSILL